MALLKPSERSLRRRFSDSSLMYAQRTYVAVMLDTLGRLLVAASVSDAEVSRELRGFPEGLTLGFSVLGDAASLRLRYQDGLLARVAKSSSPELNITFKHVSHAFMVLSFQESTPQAFANQRILMHGDAALAVRFTRCLARVQSVILPRFIAARALKAVPSMPIGEKLSLNARLYAGVALGLARRSEA